MIDTAQDTLTALPAHLIAHVTGERRKRLLEYLLRWGEPDAARACLDTWLEAQPHLATLREARARVLIEMAQSEAALPILDELDAERRFPRTDGGRLCFHSSGYRMDGPERRRRRGAFPLGPQGL